MMLNFGALQVFDEKYQCAYMNYIAVNENYIVNPMKNQTTS